MLSSLRRPPTFVATRTLAVLTAGYGAYAIARPDHLARALGEQPTTAGRRLAYTFGVRDLAISAVALTGRPCLVPVATALRVAGDLGDGAILGATSGGTARKKILGVTSGWALLNAAAFLVERRR